MPPSSAVATDAALSDTAVELARARNLPGRRRIHIAEANMKFMILVKSNPEMEARIAATSDADMQAQMAEMETFNDALRRAGVLKDCDGLRLTREGKRVHFDGASRSVVDGPFEGDLVAGYWIWELPSMDDAVAWVKRCPNPMSVPSDIEIRAIG